jgi:RHS repeat-associated protein
MDAGVTTRFLYDGVDAIAEYNASGALLRRYVHGPGVDEPIVWYEGAGTGDRRWLHADRLGSVIAVSNASGAALQLNTYDEYGVPGSSNLGRFQYTGQIWLPEASLYHYKARAYLPALGRFAQSDPILYAGGMNLYAYVGGDPVNGRDPFGLRCVIITTITWREWRNSKGELVAKEFVSAETSMSGCAGVAGGWNTNSGGSGGEEEEEEEEEEGEEVEEIVVTAIPRERYYDILQRQQAVACAMYAYLEARANDTADETTSNRDFIGWAGGGSAGALARVNPGAGALLGAVVAGAWVASDSAARTSRRSARGYAYSQSPLGANC